MIAEKLLHRSCNKAAICAQLVRHDGFVSGRLANPDCMIIHEGFAA
jgi:hypothetical protein